MSSPDDDYFDPFEAHLKRDPLPDAGVFVVVLASEGLERGQAVADSIVGLLEKRKRPTRMQVTELKGSDSRSELLRKALAEADQPLVLITHGQSSWTAEHLDPILTAIDRCDHVFGRRNKGFSAKLGRWILGAPWRWLFAVPVFDIHTPVRLHRTEKLLAIPLQSTSDFLDVEIAAKATFLGHLIDDVKVPDLDRPPARSSFGDVSLVFKNPTFLPPASIPAENSKGENEGHDGPESQDQQGGSDLDERRAFEDDGSKRVEQLRQG